MSAATHTAAPRGWDSASVLAAFHMPPQQAMAFLQAKGLQPTDAWDELWQHAHTRAFTVARSAGFDVLGDIRHALLRAMQQGQSFEDFLQALEPLLREKGWWGHKIDPDTGEIHTYSGTDRPVQLGSPRRLRLIYEQNVQTAFMAGRWQGLKAAAQTHPYWRYVAVMDDRTRHSHRAMHGRLWRHDDLVWEEIYPPNGWRCRCRVQPVSAQAVQANGWQVEDGADAGPRLRPDEGWRYNPARDYHQGLNSQGAGAAP